MFIHRKSFTVLVLSGFIALAAKPLYAQETVYVSNYGNPSGSTTVSQAVIGGSVSTFASGVASPTGLTFDGNGNLYVGNSFSGIISKIAPDGTISTFASGLNRPGTRFLLSKRRT